MNTMSQQTLGDIMSLFIPSFRSKDPKIIDSVLGDDLPPVLPTWLTAPLPSSLLDMKPSPEVKELTASQYEIIFETVLIKMEQGQSLASALDDDFRRPEHAGFLRWVLKDPIRRARYYEAQEIGAEVIASDIIRIADAEDSMEDVTRSTLRINTRKFLLGVWNKRRYGEIKQVEHSGVISISEALKEAKNRVLEVKYEVID